MFNWKDAAVSLCEFVSDLPSGCEGCPLCDSGSLDDEGNFVCPLQNAVENDDSFIQAIHGPATTYIDNIDSLKKAADKYARMPEDKEYIPVNFETVGRCPQCKAVVVDGIGHRDAVCTNCGLPLYWGGY